MLFRTPGFEATGFLDCVLLVADRFFAVGRFALLRRFFDVTRDFAAFRLFTRLVAAGRLTVRDFFGARYFLLRFAMCCLQDHIRAPNNELSPIFGDGRVGQAAAVAG